MTSPIEVWLTKRNLAVRCRIVHEDESITIIDVRSLSMRGAQREVSGRLQSDGHRPVGRWRSEMDTADQRETSRLFAN